MSVIEEELRPHPLYHLSDVQRYYRVGSGEVKAVDHVDLDLYPGELVAIEGPSGSGKSTMLQLLGALDRPTGGSVRLNDRDLATLSDGALTGIRAKEIGFVFQSFNLIPTMTAAENVAAAMVPVLPGKAARRARAAELLDRVGLAARTRHLPSLLSGGEQQRVAIARAMANHPRVILADEPTGNLDTTSAEEIGSILRSLAADEGVTVIVVTHSEHVAAWATRRLRMSDGKLFEGVARLAAPPGPPPPAPLTSADRVAALLTTLADAPAQQISLPCDDLAATLAGLRSRGVALPDEEPRDVGAGTGVTIRLPGGAEVLLYQPRA